MASGIRLTQEEAEILVQEQCIKNNYTYKPFTYINAKTILILKCDDAEHEEWKCKFGKFIYNGTGCPECKGRNSLKEKTARKRVHDICTSKGYTYDPSFTFNGSIKTIITVYCNVNGHKPYKITYNALVNQKYGCIECGGRLKLSQQKAESNVIKRCSEVGYTYRPFEYKNNNTKILLNCSITEHEEFYISYYNFISNKNGCPVCSKLRVSEKLRLSQEEAEFRLNEICLLNGYSYEPFVYINSSTVIDMKCSVPEHPSWKSSFQNTVQKRRGCPCCFIGGYDPNKPGYLYIHRIHGDDKTYYKFGITNNYEDRFKQYNNNAFKTEKFKTYYSTDGLLIKDIEYYIKYKSNIERCVLSKENYKDGYTETINESSYEQLIHIIEQYNVESIDVNAIK